GRAEEFEVLVDSRLALMVGAVEMHEEGRRNVDGWGRVVDQAKQDIAFVHWLCSFTRSESQMFVTSLVMSASSEQISCQSHPVWCKTPRNQVAEYKMHYTIGAAFAIGRRPAHLQSGSHSTTMLTHRCALDRQRGLVPMMYGGGWMRQLTVAENEKPKISWRLLRRVLAYARPYRWKIAGMLVIIVITSGLGLLTPLIMRDLIDRTLPARDLKRLALLALGLLLIPIVSAALGLWQRRLNATVGEGVIYDLRVALYAHLQQMSLRFFTNTRIGELMSRLNNDVVGAQNAISNTIVSIVTEI